MNLLDIHITLFAVLLPRHFTAGKKNLLFTFFEKQLKESVVTGISRNYQVEYINVLTATN